jgi:antitoxin (DNA-binding transcriptional repressor) of toxin-antitoxin stability system
VSVKQITTEQLRLEFPAVRRSVENGQRWLVTYHDKPRFAIVTVADLELIQQAEAKRAKARSRS